MFNAQRYMHMNVANFAPLTIWFPYEMKKIFDQILHELQYLDREHPHHFTLDLFKVETTPFLFPVQNSSICFLWHRACVRVCVGACTYAYPFECI